MGNLGISLSPVEALAFVSEVIEVIVLCELCNLGEFRTHLRKSLGVALLLDLVDL